MNHELYKLCYEYVKCFELVDVINTVHGLDNRERLMLYRQTMEQMNHIEDIIVKTIVECEMD